MDNYILKGLPSPFVDIHQKGVGWKLFELLKKHENKVMQICTETGIEDTFSHFLKRSIRTALEMKNRGVTANDMISMCSLNHLNTAVIVMASLFLNCKSACLDPMVTECEVKHLIGLVEPKILFIDQETEDLFPNVVADVASKAEVVSFGKNTKYEKFINFLTPHPEEETFLPTECENLMETILIFFSSGTTGLPKGICINHYGVMKRLSMQNGKEVLSRLIGFSSHYWMSVFIAIYHSIYLGTTRLILPKFEVKKVWDAIHVFKPTCIFALPGHILQLLREEAAGVNRDCIKAIKIGGHSITEAGLTLIRNQFPKSQVSLGFGITEAVGGITGFNLSTRDGIEKMMNKKASCGTLLPDIWYKVLDVDTGELCGPMEKGELKIKADYFMNGYYNQDSSSAWDEDGWLLTGDVVYFDEDKYMYVVDRLKDTIRYKLFQVMPGHLESVLAMHPDVVNVVVYAVPHDVDGDHAAAVVSIKRNSQVTAEELRIFADNQLDDHQKLRGGVTILEDFPRTPSGKIARRQLREYVEKIKNLILQ